MPGATAKIGGGGVTIGTARGAREPRGGYRPLFFGLGSGRVLDLRAWAGPGLNVRIRVGPAFFGFQASPLKWCIS